MRRREGERQEQVVEVNEPRHLLHGWVVVARWQVYLAQHGAPRGSVRLRDMQPSSFLAGAHPCTFACVRVRASSSMCACERAMKGAPACLVADEGDDLCVILVVEEAQHRIRDAGQHRIRDAGEVLVELKRLAAGEQRLEERRGDVDCAWA